MDALELRTRLRVALAETTQRLGAAGVPSPSVDARALIAHAAQTEQPLVMLDELPEDFSEELEQLTTRREQREPLQLILGRAPFRRLMLTVRPGVFIPRPETELALDLLRERLPETPTLVADLCAGSGALGAAVLDEIPGASVLAIEVDAEAAALSSENLELAGPGRGRVLQADLTREIPELTAAAPFDAILSNPPYIPPGAVPRDAEVIAHDPHRALFGGGDDGLEVPRAVIAWAGRLLRPGGVLIMEHADVQGAATRALAAELDCFDLLTTAPDLTGRERFLIARRSQGAPNLESERLSR
ncbi:peptide chain release factor N(5)-glutamine methyltransferase [Brachybacterium paraconglomeratum]|uniref:N5-glutamine methyltransferase family protein n=1 Tax=Brachybacterium paraconglomeratum TaxID=173362 RepID=UPI0031EABFB9